MTNTDENRLSALEMALAHHEATVDALNDVVAEQWSVIDRLRKEVEFLRDRIGQLEYGGGEKPVDEKPPHY